MAAAVAWRTRKAPMPAVEVPAAWSRGEDGEPPAVVGEAVQRGGRQQAPAAGRRLVCRVFGGGRWRAERARAADAGRRRRHGGEDWRQGRGQEDPPKRHAHRLGSQLGEGAADVESVQRAEGRGSVPLHGHRLNEHEPPGRGAEGGAHHPPVSRPSAHTGVASVPHSDSNGINALPVSARYRCPMRSPRQPPTTENNEPPP